MTTDDLPRVLLVDDRPENLLAVEAILEGLPCRAVRASSGEEALRWMLTDTFAVVVLDVQMPGLDGYATAEAIKQRERTRNVPIIFVTAIDRELRHQLRGYGSGAVDFLSKPIVPEVLRAKVSVFVELFAHRRTVERQRAELAERLAELREAQSALSRLTADLQRSNAELDRFALAVSHDLREPLQVAAGLLELLSERHRGELSLVGSELVERAADTIGDACAKVEELLELSRHGRDASSFVDVDLGVVVAEAREELREALDALGASLTWDPLPTVRGHPWQLRRLFVQLVRNAVDAGRPGLSVHVGLTRQDDRWVLNVRDDGRGMTADQLARVFAAPSGGFAGGLGLQISRRVVEQHGGVMWVESVPDVGTTVSFSLPVAAAGVQR